MSSLQRQLLVAMGVVACGAVIAIAIAARQTTRIEFQKFQNVERTLTAGADVQHSLDAVVAALDRSCCAASSMAAAQAAVSRNQGILVVTGDGHVLGASGLGVAPDDVRASFVDGRLHIEAANAAPGSAMGLALDLRGGPSASIRLADGTPATVHLVPRMDDPQQPAAQFLGSIDRRLVMAVVVIAALALGVAWLTSRRIVGPIAELSAATRDIAHGELSRRVTVHGASEIAALGESFNAMAAELERQQTLRRNLVHDVAHELRAPLTALRCRLETAIDGLAGDPAPTFEQLNEDVGHLSQLVSDLDDAARAEARDLRLSIGDVRLSDVCLSAIRAAGLEHDPRVTIEADPAAVARADAVRVRQIVVNLLTNADRYAQPGTIVVRTARRDGQVAIDVHNTGSSLTSEELARVFDRFYRTDDSRQRATGGSGLGLAIVKHLTEAQGGRAWAASDPSGVTFGVMLPSA